MAMVIMFAARFVFRFAEPHPVHERCNMLAQCLNFAIKGQMTLAGSSMEPVNLGIVLALSQTGEHRQHWGNADTGGDERYRRGWRGL